MNENAIIRKIKEISTNSEHKSFGFIAKYVMDNVATVANMTIKELATQTYSSPATINRFVNSINLDGYKEFIYVLRYFKRNYINDSQSQKQVQTVENQPEQINHQYYQALQKNLNETQNILLLQVKILQQIVHKIETAHRIHVFAFGGTFNIAADFSDKLQRINLNVTKSNDYHNGHYIAKNAQPNDIMIFVSYSGETSDLIKLAQIGQSKNVPIIAITKQSNNTLGNLSTLKLEVVSDESMRRSYSMTSRIALLSALDNIYLNLINTNWEKYASHLQKTTLEKI